MHWGRAERPFLPDRHFSAASSFHGVSRGQRIASSGSLSRVLHDYTGLQHRIRHPCSAPFADAFHLLIDLRIFGSDLGVTWH
jgi:hypothetical protein